MFTGIITDIGKIKKVTCKDNKDTIFTIETNYDTKKIALGASISCDGVCLTVVKKNKNCFDVTASEATLLCTTLASWQENTKINLERALKLGDELGGHMVSGHVDAVGTVKKITKNKNSHEYYVSFPRKLKKYIVKKGSVTINGVSLTINAVKGNSFSMNIIPHTYANTTFQFLQEQNMVNLEIDLIARYLVAIVANKN